MNYSILPPEEPLCIAVDLPQSKSLKNRLMILSAMAGAPLPAMHPEADCADTEAMHRALVAVPAPGATVDVGGAGTAMRFLTAWFASRPGTDLTLTGNERMSQRPMAPLVDALRALGADITYLAGEGHAPLRIRGCRLTGGHISVDAGISSQFISALMMVAPAMDAPLVISLEGNPVSRPYISMTAGLLSSYGARVEIDTDPDVVTVHTAQLTPPPHGMEVESDWSAASYWYETAALSCGTVTLRGLHPHSLQGDSHIARLMEVTGLRTEFAPDGSVEIQPTPDVLDHLVTDLSSTPDLLPAMAVTCCLLGVPFRFTGLSTLPLKESDRIATVSQGLLSLGYLVEPTDSSITWRGVTIPVDPQTPAVIATHGDHRLAMAFAPAALFHPGLIIAHAEVVEKSYPRFWQQLAQAGFTLTPVELPQE